MVIILLLCSVSANFAIILCFYEIWLRLFTAPPNFIERPQPYVGARWNDQFINLTCRVECSPLCTISWSKNGRPIDKGLTNRYDVRELVERSNPTANIFESVRSTLIWNMAAWPGSQLDRMIDNANYSCHSSGNIVGTGVNSTTTFGVECKFFICSHWSLSKLIVLSLDRYSKTVINTQIKLICRVKIQFGGVQLEDHKKCCYVL